MSRMYYLYTGETDREGYAYYIPINLTKGNWTEYANIILSSCFN